MENTIIPRNVNVLAFVNLQQKRRKVIHEELCALLYHKSGEIVCSSRSTILNEPLSLDKRWARYDEEFEIARASQKLLVLCLEKEDYEVLKMRHPNNSLAVIFDAERYNEDDLFLPSVCSPGFIAKMTMDTLNRRETDSKRKLLRA